MTRGLHPRSGGSGAGDPLIRCGAGDPLIRSGAGDPLIRSGAGDPLIRSGAGDPLIRSGAGGPLIRSGAGGPLIRSGAGDPLIRCRFAGPACVCGRLWAGARCGGGLPWGCVYAAIGSRLRLATGGDHWQVRRQQATLRLHPIRAGSARRPLISSSGPSLRGRPPRCAARSIGTATRDESAGRRGLDHSLWPALPRGHGEAACLCVPDGGEIRTENCRIATTRPSADFGRHTTAVLVRRLA